MKLKQKTEQPKDETKTKTEQLRDEKGRFMKITKEKTSNETNNTNEDETKTKTERTLDDDKIKIEDSNNQNDSTESTEKQLFRHNDRDPRTGKFISKKIFLKLMNQNTNRILAAITKILIVLSIVLLL